MRGLRGSWGFRGLDFRTSRWGGGGGGPIPQFFLEYSPKRKQGAVHGDLQWSRPPGPQFHLERGKDRDKDTQTTPMLFSTWGICHLSKGAGEIWVHIQTSQT